MPIVNKNIELLNIVAVNKEKKKDLRKQKNNKENILQKVP